MLADHAQRGFSVVVASVPPPLSAIVCAGDPVATEAAPVTAYQRIPAAIPQVRTMRMTEAPTVYCLGRDWSLLLRRVALTAAGARDRAGRNTSSLRCHVEAR